MSGEEQERFADYLELERFIAEIQAGHVAHPPQELTPEQARVYRMATLFSTATPGASELDPAFAEQLQARLESELSAMQHGNSFVPPGLSSPLPPRRRVSRRRLLGGSAAVAASVALGAGVEHLLEQGGQPVAGSPVTIKSASATNWFAVTTVAELGSSAVQFKVENAQGSLLLTGYVVHSEGTNGGIIAMSAACTHRGCIVQWSGSERKFHCPCHGGVFTENGGIDAGTSALVYIDPLPRLDVKVDDDGQISVRMSESKG